MRASAWRSEEEAVAAGSSLPGRGAWLCPGHTCLAQAERRRAFPRALKQDIADGAVTALRANMEANEEDGRA